MIQASGTGPQSSQPLSLSIPSAGFYSLGVELDGTVPPGESLTVHVTAGSTPSRSCTVAIAGAVTKSSGAATDIYLEPTDGASYQVTAVNASWTARFYLYQATDIA